MVGPTDGKCTGCDCFKDPGLLTAHCTHPNLFNNLKRLGVRLSELRWDAICWCPAVSGQYATPEEKS